MNQVAIYILLQFGKTRKNGRKMIKKKLNLKILITLEVAVAMAYNVYLASGPSEFESYFIGM